MSSEYDWKARIEAAILSGMNESEIDRLMEPIACDRAEIPLGGTGAAALVFRLAGDVDAWFQLDGEGHLVLYAVYEQPQGWIKDKDGTLTGAAATPAVLLTLAP